MALEVPFSLKIEGDEADRHLLPAYDGFTALAGFSLSLALVTNYVETGKIRRRGSFRGRSDVLVRPIENGSIVSDFVVRVGQIGVLKDRNLSAGTAAEVLYDVFRRTIDRNLGREAKPETDQLEELERTRHGDLEALASAVEPSVKQSHQVIGSGVKLMTIYGGPHTIGSYDLRTKEYVESSFTDSNIVEKDVSVASFNANSGYGSIFDRELGRTIPIQLTKDTLDRAKSVLSWGLNEYANSTGRNVSLKFFSVLAMDETPKKYIVVDAHIPSD